MKALSPLPLQSSAVVFSPSASEPRSFLLLSVFPCIVCYRGSSSLLLSLPGAVCHPDGSLHSSFFYDYFLSNSFTASPAFFSRGFCGSSLAAYTHNYLCTLRLLPRQFIPRARRGGKTILIRAAAVRVPSDRAPPPRGSKLLSFELINTKKKKSFAACLV